MEPFLRSSTLIIKNNFMHIKTNHVIVKNCLSVLIYSVSLLMGHGVYSRSNTRACWPMTALTRCTWGEDSHWTQKWSKSALAWTCTLLTGWLIRDTLYHLHRDRLWFQRMCKTVLTFLYLPFPHHSPAPLMLSHFKATVYSAWILFPHPRHTYYKSS